MKHPPRKRRSAGHYIVAGIATVLLAALAYFTLLDPYSGQFDPPRTFNLALHRIDFGFKSLVGGVDGRIRSTNDSMQDTVDHRKKRNDERLRKDTQRPDE